MLLLALILGLAFNSGFNLSFSPSPVIALLLLALVFAFSGQSGLAVLFSASLFGLLPEFGGFSKSALCGSVMVPAMLFHLGA